MAQFSKVCDVCDKNWEMAALPMWMPLGKPNYNGYSQA